jgi:uncharacterized protein involved in exopolysaccharide biosynthesis
MSSQITIVSLLMAMRDKVMRHGKLSSLCIVAILVLSQTYAVLRPAEYVASMVVVPIETSVTDATTQLLSTGFSLRPQLSFGGPPPQMAAFLTVLNSPEVARYVVKDPRAVEIIIGHRVGMLRRLKNALGFAPPQETAESRISAVKGWLDSHVTVRQDIVMMAWTINVRDADGQAAAYILSLLQKDSEDILRRAAVKQYSTQQVYVTDLISQTGDAAVKQTLYTVLTSINRSLVVLKSGSSIATNVISDPYVPNGPTYPSRLLSLMTSIIVLSSIAFLWLAYAAYRGLKRLHYEAAPGNGSRQQAGYAVPNPSHQN